MAFTFELDSRGYLKKRESFNLEYKQNFQLGDNLLKYIKTLVGMANNKGGQIIFGVQNSPHIPTGMTNMKLHEIDPKEIDSKIREYFAPGIRWNVAFQEQLCLACHPEQRLRRRRTCHRLDSQRHDGGQSAFRVGLSPRC